MSAEEKYSTTLAQAISNPVPSRNYFQVRFVLDAIFSVYKDKQLKKSKIIKLGDDLRKRGVLPIKPSDWESLKKKDRLTILSQIFNGRSRLQETFITRDICMKWVFDKHPCDHEEFLQKETDFVLERLCDARAAYRVSNHWCGENNFKTEDSSDVLHNICKALRRSDKEFVTKCITVALKQREEEFGKFKQEEWLSAAIHRPEAITWNPLLFDVCATKFNTVIPIIANMALPKNKDAPVMCECRIYPTTNYRTATYISATTLIRQKFETYVGAVQDVFDVYEMDVLKVMSENKRVHEDLQEAMIDNRKLLEERYDLWRQLTSKAQTELDAVAALQRVTEDLKHRNEELTTENTDLKTMLKDYEKENEKIEELEKKDKEKSKDIEELKKRNGTNDCFGGYGQITIARCK